MSDPSSLKEDIRDWVRTLQQALTVEADKNFIDVQGRTDKFHSFVYKQLCSSTLYLLSVDNQAQIREIASKFLLYPELPLNSRRRIVVDTRQFLYNLRSCYQDPIPAKEPVLKLAESGSDASVSSISSSVLDLKSNLNSIKGIGSKLSEKLSGLGLIVIKDILFYFPRDYVDYSSLKRINRLEIGQTATVLATVKRCNSFTSPKNPNLSILELHVYDITGRLKVTRFFAGRRQSNRGFLKTQERLYRPGSHVAISGLVKQSVYGISINDPIIEVLENSNSYIKSYAIGRLLPIYGLTEGVSADRFRKIVQSVLPFTSKIIDPLPSSLLLDLKLPSKSEALKQIHFPETKESLFLARRRLVFDEFLLLQLSLLLRRNKNRSLPSPSLSLSIDRNYLVDNFLSSLPFSLTTSQQRVLAEIQSDIMRPQPMARLLQGDVGSGKTVIAIAALLTAVQSGWQGAFMAPTEVLASQHFQTLYKWLPRLDITIELLTGSTPKSRRKQILSDISNGSTKIIVGTHALLEDPVDFECLGLVVVDEQHRFGVHQRNRLLNKGLQPHLLSMTATPIPRTLALSLHGDLDVSQLDELPPGRTAIETRLVPNTSRQDAYDLIREEVNAGRQAYVVLPLVEESDKLELNSAIEMYKSMTSNIFPDYKVGLLHGRMTGAEKKDVIDGFANKKISILVATTVIEVGVDVPNATVMLIDNADRFGLSQLHQLRGRVGRGASQSYCILIYQPGKKPSKQRLDVLLNSNDGFEISEIDLRLRGPGQVLGTRQSGLPDLALASLVDDADILELARIEAKKILSDDPNLDKYKRLKEQIKEQVETLRALNQLN